MEKIVKTEIYLRFYYKWISVWNSRTKLETEGKGQTIVYLNKQNIIGTL